MPSVTDAHFFDHAHDAVLILELGGNLAVVPTGYCFFF